MAVSKKYSHAIRNDRVHDQLEKATDLGKAKIPTEMSWVISQIKAGLRAAAETLDDATVDLRDRWTEGERDESGELTKPAPVYATDDTGAVKYKIDPKTKEPTSEPDVLQGRIKLTNSVLHQREERALMRQHSEVIVPHIDYNVLKSKVPTIEPNTLEALADYLDNAPAFEVVSASPAAPVAPARKPKAAKDSGATT